MFLIILMWLCAFSHEIDNNPSSRLVSYETSFYMSSAITLQSNPGLRLADKEGFIHATPFPNRRAPAPGVEWAPHAG